MTIEAMQASDNKASLPGVIWLCRCFSAIRVCRTPENAGFPAMSAKQQNASYYSQLCTMSPHDSDPFYLRYVFLKYTICKY
jgi:hypothetical protein